ncbi:PIF1-like helicase [Hirsutella rhossiliensis]|uniref:PIF1-like helicase domain-containing protein n=1 Tax=Hirsutella rhossiliensis TaxID=111463 RepID=A0A9P8MVC8_9HYPO|nr:PIF1-like helicase domain-containing protein [Hirsutella rhossiliensis]KAH0962087.1 PIF1-like helicase domain-containing protein [Hirsutella rhossiliensis]
MFPDELKGLTPVEEKLIALNSCYGFVTRYNVSGGPKQTLRYPKHVKGHITVFPNNVQELLTKVLPHPFFRVMDEIHVSWQGAVRPTPSDLSGLLSVRRRVVERALIWLKRNNPHYAEIEIDVAEMESWGDPAHGVPPLVYGRLERNEPSAWEKTRTAHVVPPTERAMDDEGAVEIEEVLALLNQGESRTSREAGEPGSNEAHEAHGQSDGETGDDAKTINEVTSSGMFALDGPPDVADVDKLRFACDAVRDGAADGGTDPRTGSNPRQGGSRGMPMVLNRTFIFAVGMNSPTRPRSVDEATLHLGRGGANTREPEVGTQDLVSSRNMSLRTWADTVLRRHGGRFATHHIFAFLAFNMGVRSRNRRVSMLSVTRKNFGNVERIVRSLTADGLAAARAELESTGKTTDDAVKELLRSLSLYGYRQPMSRELRLSMRHKILALIVRYGVPAIWFTINPNDITNPVKLRLAAYRTRDPEAAEAFLRSLDMSFKRVRLSVSDPMSSAMFFHREMALFFEHYVNAGGESVFGRISQYYGAVETNERGSLHVHGLLWLHGNAHLGSMLADAHGEEQAAYRERIVRYVDSVFCEDLDQEGFAPAERFSAAFEEEANFCAGATQIHTHSPTCVKYSLGDKGRKGDLCRFKAPWKLVEKTAFSPDGVLRIRRTHPMVNRWNKAIAVGLRHNHDISFIATQRKTTALVYYVTNYATKVEDPTWKRVAAAADLLPVVSAGEDAGSGVVGGDDGTKNKTRQFLMRVANRVFTERALSQVEVVAHLLGYPSEFTSSSAWAYLNVSVLYWHVSRRWRHLRQESGTAVADVSVDESVVVEEAGERISFAEAYHHRGNVLRGLCLYDYVSLVRLQRVGKDGCSGAWGEVAFESGWVAGKDWVQVLRRPGKHAVVCLDGYLSKDFEEDDEDHAIAGQPEERGDINDIWRRAREQLPPRTSCLVDNVQLLRRSAEDAKRDAKQWAASSGDGEGGQGQGQADHEAASAYQSDDVGMATRLIDVVRSAAGANQITAGSQELSGMMQQLCRFQQSALASTAELQATMVTERGGRYINMPGQVFSGAAVPPQDQAIAFSIICRHLDSMRERDGGDVSQLCQFVGGEGGTGKSRVIEALVGLFAAKGISSRLLVTATSGTAAARSTASPSTPPAASPGPRAGREHGEERRRHVLVIDEVSMLGARTLHAVNERLCQLRGSRRDFGGIPIVLFCGDFHQFRPVQERSILLPSAAVSWDEDSSFRAEQRHQHDRAHALWRRFTTVVMLDEQMRAAGDPELQGLLRRIRRGVQDHADLDLLNSRCHREGRRIPWETGITVVTPLNRNRWNLNMEASLAFQIQQRSTVRIFLSEHKWKDGLPTEEEAITMLNQGDDSAIPVPAVFMFVPGMPVVVNHNTHQGLKLVNGAGYTAAEVIIDKAYPGHRISADMTIHFGPPAAIILGVQRQRKRPWQQNDVSRKGLPCAAAFACTDYKVQGGTLERVALELRGTRTTNVGGRAVPSQCDPYSLYVQLSRCPTLDGIMLVSKVRERDLVGNRVPGEMTAAQARLEELSDRSVREALCWLGDDLDAARQEREGLVGTTSSDAAGTADRGNG